MAVEVIVTNGTAAAKRRIDAIKVRTEYPDRAWQAVGRFLSREVDRQFITRGANFGTPWKPLSTRTLLQKRRLGFTGQPLVRTGAMKRSFMYPAIIKNARGATATFGSDSDIAAYQHFGTFVKGKRHIPPRKIMKVTPKVREQVREILARYIIENET